MIRGDWRASARRAAPACAMLAAICLTACRSAGAPRPADPLHELHELLALVEQKHVREVPREQLVRAARDAMLASLDPYSSYLDAATVTELKAALAGRFGGVGMRLDGDPARTRYWVMAPMAGSPAFQAGIRAGDVIMSVDGRSPSGQTLDTVLDWLRGAPGTDVAIEVQRSGVPAPLRLRVTRAVIALPSVRGARRTADGAWDYRLATAEDIAYLRIAHFATTTPDEVATALAAITASRPRALVLDLRHDPGGSLTAAIGVADQFLDHGRIVSERARGGVTTHHDATPGSGTTLPVALLVDEATMSAAEIVAAALQDNGRALVVGTRSYGKATVQELFPLADGAGAYRLTTEDYLRPSGGPLERHLPGSDAAAGGVVPDDGLAVTLTAAEAEAIGQSLATLDVTSTLIGLPASDGPPTPDPVLAAACGALRAGRAPTLR